MNTLISLFALSSSLLNPTDFGLADTPGLQFEVRKQMQVAHGDAVHLVAKVDGITVHGMQIVVRRSNQGETLFIRRAGVPKRFDRLGTWTISADQAWQAARAEAPPVRYSNEAEARRHSTTFKA